MGLLRDETQRYGIVLVDADKGKSAWVAVTFGRTATDADVLLDSNGIPVFKRDLAKSAYFFSGANSAAMGRVAINSPNGLGWMFQYDTGLTTLRPARHLTPTYIGIDPLRLSTGGIDPTTAESGPAYLALGTERQDFRMTVSCLATGVTTTAPWRNP
jgi:hypothetical protein